VRLEGSNKTDGFWIDKQNNFLTNGLGVNIVRIIIQMWSKIQSLGTLIHLKFSRDKIFLLNTAIRS
jgi:hypothetical protein